MAKQKIVTDWNDVPLYMDLPYLATLFGYSVECLKKKAQKGELPAAKIFGGWRISKEDAKKYYEAQKNNK